MKDGRNHNKVPKFDQIRIENDPDYCNYVIDSVVHEQRNSNKKHGPYRNQENIKAVKEMIDRGIWPVLKTTQIEGRVKEIAERFEINERTL